MKEFDFTLAIFTGLIICVIFMYGFEWILNFVFDVELEGHP